jgi:putative hydrolase of the HAD superfamily
MITTIIFDLGQVVVSFDWQKALQRAAQQTDVRYEDILKYFTDPANDTLFVEGKMSAHDFFEQVQKKFHFSLSYDEFREIYNDIFSPMPETEELIKVLEKEYRLVILSNTNEFHFPHILNTYPIMDYFDEFILSYEEKCQKPNYEIFERALKKLRVSPQETIFIDDNEKNVHSAEQLGIRGIHFTGIKALRDGLKKYGVKDLS